MAEKVQVLSGVQPTGQAHIGNWLGAFRRWVELQETRTCFYCIVDLHALTTAPDPGTLREASLAMARVFLAIGLDPSRSALFLQSAVPGHTDLAWILLCQTAMGDLQRMTQFKDKAERQPRNVNAGLFSYPVLQAADILVYRAAEVPVGEDQVQHLELAREIARRFNRRYGDLLPEPRALLAPAARILGLDGKSKMSKSAGNHLPLLAEPDEIARLLRGAVTDPQRLRRSDPGRPEVCNVFTLHQQFSSPEEVAEVGEECRSAGRGCVDCKLQLARNVADRLAPIRERARALEDDPGHVQDVLAEGARRARAVAAETMEAIRNAVGLAAAD